MLAASLPEQMTLKSRSRFSTIASSNWTYDRSAPRNWPSPSDSELSASEAHLLTLSQLRRLGCSSASHGGTYQPMMPMAPSGPASMALPSPSSAKTFFSRSGWPQSSMTMSTSPVPKPCQETSSLSSLYSTVQPSSCSATVPTTYALAS